MCDATRALSHRFILRIWIMLAQDSGSCVLPELAKQYKVKIIYVRRHSV
jgi:hypothetical protein